MIPNKIAEYKAQGILCELNQADKDKYIAFLECTIIDKLETAEKTIKKKPWDSITLGFYAIHDMTRLYLIKKYNVQITLNEKKRYGKTNGN